jgi:hypothetical protein
LLQQVGKGVIRLSEQIRSQGNESDIRKKWHDWKIRNPLIEYAMYPLVVSIVCVPIIYIFHHNIFYPTEISNTQYLLSALVQCEAAIVAIVITLTMLAIQLTYSEYSPRVINILINNPDMKILLSLYGISIFYGLFVLRAVEAAEGSIGMWGYNHILFIMPSEYISHEFERFVSLALLLGIFSVVALIPYIQNTIKLLNPKAIIDKQLESLSVKKLLTDDDTKKEKSIKRLRLVVDIIRGSIRKSDLETTREGLEALTSRVIQQLDDTNSSNGKKISEIFCEHLKGIAELAENKRDEASVIEVIKNLKDFGKQSAEKELVNATREVASSLGTVGEAAAENGFKIATKQVVLSLKDIGMDAAKNNFEEVIEQVAKLLGGVGEAAAKNELKIATKQVVESLEVVGKTAAKENLKEAVKEVAKSLESVGKTSIENRLQDTAKHAIVSLEAVAKDAADKDLADFLGTLGVAAAKKGKDLEEVVMEALRSLRAIGKEAIENGWADVISRTIFSLGNVGEEAANKEQELQREVIRSAWFLKDIGEKAIEAGNKNEVEKVVYTLKRIEEIAVGKGKNEVSTALGVIEHMINDSKSST